MVRVKQTGEVCEVSRETMKILRNEEKKLRRSMSGVPVIGCEEEETTLLSLDYVSYEGGEDMSPAWLADPLDFENDALFHIRLKEFKAVLTPLELSVFECCIVRDLTMRGYEEELTRRAVVSLIEYVRVNEDKEIEVRLMHGDRFASIVDFLSEQKEKEAAKRIIHLTREAV